MKEKKKETKTLDYSFFSSIFPYLEYWGGDNTKRTFTPYGITDESVGKYFTLLPSNNFCNFYEHDPKMEINTRSYPLTHPLRSHANAAYECCINWKKKSISQLRQLFYEDHYGAICKA